MRQAATTKPQRARRLETGDTQCRQGFQNPKADFQTQKKLKLFCGD
jgi:hypothetical protein